MKATDGLKHKRKKMPLALGGLFVGAGIAFWLVRRQRKLMPWTALDRNSNDFSIYKVSGDSTGEFTGDWPVGFGDLPPAVPEVEKAAGTAEASLVYDESSAEWGDAPAMGIAPDDAGGVKAASGSGGDGTVDESGKSSRGGSEEAEGACPQPV